MRVLSIMLAGMGLAMGDVHPRLLFPATLEAEVKQRIATDSLAGDLQRQVLTQAEQVLRARTCEYLIPDGKRLLAESRLAIFNVLHCGWAWRTTGEDRFRARVIEELDAACALKDWNPSHFLDTAEMATAVAIGYDWLYPVLTPEQRGRYQIALLDKALRVVGVKHARSAWWTDANNNWSQVCATGMGLAAEAVRECDPALCDGILKHTGELIGKCRRFYEPNGAYPEGPSYWHYGTNYHVLSLAYRQALRQPVEVPAVLQDTGDFIMHVVGPTGLPFNFADSHASPDVPSPAQSWLASSFKNVAQARYVRASLQETLLQKRYPGTSAELRFFPFHLLWLPANPPEDGTAPLTRHFNGEQSCAFFRTSWQPTASWLAIKGGTGGASHGHLDAGSFVFDAGGQRWFHDLGSDNYNLPGYFGSQRFDYLRLTNHSHSTLVIGDKLQTKPRTGCIVSDWKSSGSRWEAAIDLTPAYQGQAEKVERRVMFDTADGSVMTSDSLVEPTGSVRWAVVTQATPEIDGQRVILKQKGKRLILTRHDAAGGAWEEFSLKPASAGEARNQGFHLIGFTAPVAEKLRLEVAWEIE